MIPVIGGHKASILDAFSNVTPVSTGALVLWSKGIHNNKEEMMANLPNLADRRYVILQRATRDSNKVVEPSQEFEDATYVANLTGEALGKDALVKMRKPAIGCFAAGTLVHTKDGLKPIEQINVGDWVLSRPENPDDGTETGYKRVTKTFKFEDKEVVRFWWAPDSMAVWEDTESVYVTPNHPVWLNPDGWVEMGRLHLPEKMRFGSISRGVEPWLGKELVLADGKAGAMLDVMELFQTDKSSIAFGEEDDPDWGCAVQRRRFPVGKESHPAKAPAGSNRSGHGGNEMAEAFG